MAKKSENMDITLDFSWIKKLFSNKNKDSNNLFAKYGFLLLLLIPIILSIYIRTIPYDLPMAEQWATQSVVNSIRADIQQQINKQYANLPQQSKDALINEQLQVVLSQQQDQINSVISAQTEQIKLRFRDETGTTYLGDIDSYFWLRYARNIIETGQLPDEYRDGIGIDNRMNAPNGAGATNNLYPYVEVFLYKVMKIFDSSFNLLKSGFYTPLFLSFFAIAAAFFIGKKLSGNVAGLLAS
ncbi:MAG: STT3 domain-containing protein, partial [Nanoarchaeota archaeon]